MAPGARMTLYTELRPNLVERLKSVTPLVFVDILFGLGDLGVKFLLGKGLVVEVKTDEYGSAIPVLGKNDGAVRQIGLDLGVL